ncbi:MAG TPA: plastocyanin/azurin family copper-binding protein [Candidatus Paceibacterota bacterium]|nr:plastocyanin/azurin family copper-binding protein [Candidatus Paceibacterota bacterium]
MKNIIIIIIVLIVLVGGAVFFMGTGKKAEAPIENTPPISTDNNQNNSQVACTMEAKLCPDGSYVGRTGPKCEFSACPTVKNTNTNTDTTSPTVKEFTVSGQNFSFTPSLITVAKGDKVKITFNNVNGFHNFKIDEFGVASPQKQSPDTEVLEFTADKVGSFQYYCSVGSHRAMGMWGTLKVE